ncbi:MAG: sugar phosphate isomerase/epimerase [Clostridia bacterium]|nr:sugar phosphate isomerase/epimerase [Clostridia bacterium]
MSRMISVQTGGVINVFGVEEGMRLIAAAGFDGVDLGLCDYLPGKKIHKGLIEGEFTLPEEEFLDTVIRPVREAAEKHGLRFAQAHAPYSSWTPFSEPMNDFLMRSFEMCLAACRYLSCPYLVIHPACMHYEHRLDPAFEYELNMTRYAALIPAARRAGVRILLENMFSSCNGKALETACADMHDACRYIDALNEKAGEELFGFCYDTGHAALLGKDQGIAIHTLGKRLMALHLHDNDGSVDRHRFPYSGVIDWDMVLRSLREIGYAGAINFETSGEMAAYGNRFTPKLLELLGEIGRSFARVVDGDSAAT